MDRDIPNLLARTGDSCFPRGATHIVVLKVHGPNNIRGMNGEHLQLNDGTDRAFINSQAFHQQSRRGGPVSKDVCITLAIFPSA